MQGGAGASAAGAEEAASNAVGAELEEADEYALLQAAFNFIPP